MSRQALHPQVVDVGNSAAVAAAAKQLIAQVGPAKIVVSGAAVVRGVPVLDLDPEQLRSAFDVNVLSSFWLARAFLPHMLSSHTPRGVFVTIGSLMADLPAARLSEYCAAKAAVSQLHECLRWELRNATGGLGGGGAAASMVAARGVVGGATAARAAVRDVRCLHVQPYLVDPQDSPLFAGGTPVKYAWARPLVPPLRAATVAKRIVWAIEASGPGSSGRLVVPYVFKWLAPVLTCVPSVVRDWLLDLAGAGCAMDGFVGRQQPDGSPRVAPQRLRAAGSESVVSASPAAQSSTPTRTRDVTGCTSSSRR